MVSALLELASPPMLTDDRRYEQAVDATEARLKPLLTPEFLSTLVEAARAVGWGVDHIEVEKFVRYVYEIAGAPEPETVEPYNEP